MGLAPYAAAAMRATVNTLLSNISDLLSSTLSLQVNLKSRTLFVTIGEIASQCGLRTSAIRYYEEAGVLPKSPRAGGRRVYGTDAVKRIAFIQFAQQAGFSLAEIKILSGARDPAR